MEGQSRQSARLFLQSSELGLPQPLTRRRVCPPLLVGGGGGGNSLAGEGVVGPNSVEGTDTVVLLPPYVLCEWRHFLKLKCP